MEILVPFLGTGVLVCLLRRYVYKQPPLLPALARWLLYLNDRANHYYWDREVHRRVPR
jgi:hypothetical protein